MDDKSYRFLSKDTFPPSVHGQEPCNIYKCFLCLIGHRIPTAQQSAWGAASHLELGSHCSSRRAFHIRTNAPGPGVVQVDAKLLSLAQWPGDFLGRHFILSLEWNCTHRL